MIRINFDPQGRPISDFEITNFVNKIIKKKGKLKINIFPNTQITKKPLEVRMGKGKGNLDR
jgi:ribosomal protein L16/L10AE